MSEKLFTQMNREMQYLKDQLAIYEVKNKDIRKTMNTRVSWTGLAKSLRQSAKQ